MLARGDNVSNVSRVFGCHRNTIILLRQRFQQTDRVADRRRSCRPRVTTLERTGSTSFSNGDKFCKTVRYQQTDSVVPPQESPAAHSAKEALSVTSTYSTSSGARLQWAQRHFRWGRQQWVRVLFSDESTFNRSHHDGRFEFLEKEGNVLLIIVSLRGTNLEVGVLGIGWHYGQKGKKISLLCKATSLLKVTLTRFCSLKLFLFFKGMDLQY